LDLLFGLMRNKFVQVGQYARVSLILGSAEWHQPWLQPLFFLTETDIDLLAVLTNQPTLQAGSSQRGIKRSRSPEDTYGSLAAGGDGGDEGKLPISLKIFSDDFGTTYQV
jgi:hypothetical protein